MKNIYFACITALFLLASCGKEDKQGCQDPEAANYDADATEDCCCNYKGKVLFWYDKPKSDALKAKGQPTLVFYVDKKPAGSYSSAVSWNVPPECDAYQTITIEKDLGSESAKTFEYLVVDHVGQQIWKGTQEWKANTCTRIQLK